MSRLKRRRVTIRLVANSAEDPKRILQAVEDVLRPNDVEIRVEEAAPQPSADVAPAQRGANEQLETELRERVGGQLADKREKIAAALQSSGRPADARAPESPEDIVAKRTTLLEKLGLFRKAGYRVTLKVAWEMAKEIATDIVM